MQKQFLLINLCSYEVNQKKAREEGRWFTTQVIRFMKKNLPTYKLQAIQHPCWLSCHLESVSNFVFA